jgi:hypothetical protein
MIVFHSSTGKERIERTARNIMCVAWPIMNNKSETKIGLAVIHVKAREMILPGRVD